MSVNIVLNNKKITDIKFIRESYKNSKDLVIKINYVNSKNVNLFEVIEYQNVSNLEKDYTKLKRFKKSINIKHQNSKQ